VRWLWLSGLLEQRLKKEWSLGYFMGNLGELFLSSQLFGLCWRSGLASM
jgi:hypothetical protein